MFYIWLSFDVSSLRVCVSPCNHMGFKKRKRRRKDSCNSDTFTQLQMLILKPKQIKGGGGGEGGSLDEATRAGGKLQESTFTPKAPSGTQGASEVPVLCATVVAGMVMGCVCWGCYCSAGFGFARKAGDGHKPAGKILGGEKKALLGDRDGC